MSEATTRALLLGACCVLAACATPPPARQALCAGKGYSIAVDFPGAGDHACRIDAEGVAIIQIRPETRPINPSPWYAFAVDSKRNQNVRVRLAYDGAEHRYSPKLRDANGAWEAIESARVAIAPGGAEADLRLAARRGRTMVAAQPVESAADLLDWARKALLPARFEERIYGQSIEDRPLVAFVGGPADADRLVIALTRQHPPERSGTVAFKAFAEAIAGAPGPQRVLLVPVANPDGLDGGHWRGNAAGVDLNRDWGVFAQPETRALAALIEREAEGRRIVAQLDFHSTYKSVIYAPLKGLTPELDAAMSALEAIYAARLEAPPPWSYAHDPAAGTSKGWALERFGALGLTIELEDEARDDVARAVGQATALAAAAEFGASRALGPGLN
jgi:hypothetical protein